MTALEEWQERARIVLDHWSRGMWGAHRDAGRGWGDAPQPWTPALSLDRLDEAPAGALVVVDPHRGRGRLRYRKTDGGTWQPEVVVAGVSWDYGPEVESTGLPCAPWPIGDVDAYCARADEDTPRPDAAEMWTFAADLLGVAEPGTIEAPARVVERVAEVLLRLREDRVIADHHRERGGR